MTLTPLYEPADEPMRVVGLMSGKGTNLVKILEHQETLRRERGVPPYVAAAIFSDVLDSNAVKIGAHWDLPVITRDIDGYYRQRGFSKKTMHGEGAVVRKEFDTEIVRALWPFAAHVAAYAGYMSAASSVLVNALLGVNVHPADLTVRDVDGTPKYRGDRAVLNALKAGEKTLRASTHIIAEEIDQGPVLMVSAPLPVVMVDGKSLEQLADEHQDRLKEIGDWKIFPLTLQFLAEGRFAKDESGLLHFDGQPIPNGWRMEG